MSATTLRTIADRLTLARLASVPLVWVLALAGRETLLALVLAAASATDMVDGPLARRSGVPSPRGARLDSVADLLLIVSAGVFLLLLRPGFVAEHRVILILWAGVGVAALLVGWLKFRRVANLHLYSAKAAGVVAWVFLVWILLLGSVPAWLFNLAASLAIFACLEALAVQIVRREVDEHVRSLFLAVRRRST